MNEIIPKSPNHISRMDSSKKQISLIKLKSSKINSSQLIRNSYSYKLDQFKDEYQNKYFELYNKSIKGDTPKEANKIKNKSNLKFKKYNKKQSAIYSNGNCNSINNYLEKLYQNEKHMKKNILKKKKVDSNKKINPKVSLSKNLSRKNDSTRNSIKKVHYLNNKKELEDNKKSETKNIKEDITEKEDDQEYGFNKRYEIKMFDELNKEKNRINEAIHNTRIIHSSLFKKDKETFIELKNKKLNKTFIIPKFQDSLMENLRETFLKLKSNKTIDNKNFKKINRKLIKHKKVRIKDKRNHKVVNINYNINVNEPNNDKHKNNAIKKREKSKIIKIINITENINKPELLIINKNKESVNTNKTSNIKENNNKDKNKVNSPIKAKQNHGIYKYIHNCCFPFASCFKGNND